ncbi:hypothetical protein [Christensenella hongkongensis]|nr:hypothetical protein [Christensenella hongkongensis]
MKTKMFSLLKKYRVIETPVLHDIIELYVRYESICPFQNADVAKREQ